MVKEEEAQRISSQCVVWQQLPWSAAGNLTAARRSMSQKDLRQNRNTDNDEAQKVPALAQSSGDKSAMAGGEMMHGVWDSGLEGEKVGALKV